MCGAATSPSPTATARPRCATPPSSIPRGTITALVGVNGSGKSTLFKAIMGFVPAARGARSASSGSTVREALKRNLVAYVPQAEEVDWAFPVLVEDVVMMGRYGHMGFLRRARAADRAAVDAALARVGMAEYRHRQIGELSGGQQQARLPRPGAGAGRPGHPARRALHRRRRQHRGADHRAPARPARRGPGDAGLDPQPRLGARVLRPRRPGQGHRPRLRPDRRRLHRATTSSTPSAACCATSRSSGGAPARRRRPAPRSDLHRRRAAAGPLRRAATAEREPTTGRAVSAPARALLLRLHDQRHVGLGAGRRRSARSCRRT